VTDPPTVDGRRARAQRGREAVLATMLDLLEARGSAPTAEEVAERAGVSMSSVYRYFGSLDDLQREAALRFLDRHAARFELDREGEGPLSERIERIVGARTALYRTIGPVARVGRSRAVDNPALDEVLTAFRRSLAAQVHRHFAPELAALPADEGADVGALAALLLAIESWDQLHLVASRSDEQVGRAWRLALTRLLAGTAAG